MTGDDPPVSIDQQRGIEAKGLNALGDGANLGTAVLARVVGGWDQVADVEKRNLPAVGVRFVGC